jgi:hypothetical protein
LSRSTSRRWVTSRNTTTARGSRSAPSGPTMVRVAMIDQTLSPSADARSPARHW